MPLAALTTRILYELAKAATLRLGSSPEFLHLNMLSPQLPRPVQKPPSPVHAPAYPLSCLELRVRGFGIQVSGCDFLLPVSVVGVLVLQRHELLSGPAHLGIVWSSNIRVMALSCSISGIPLSPRVRQFKTQSFVTTVAILVDNQPRAKVLTGVG